MGNGQELVIVQGRVTVLLLRDCLTSKYNVSSKIQVITAGHIPSIGGDPHSVMSERGQISPDPFSHPQASKSYFSY